MQSVKVLKVEENFYVTLETSHIAKVPNSQIDCDFKLFDSLTTQKFNNYYESTCLNINVYFIHGSFIQLK